MENFNFSQGIANRKNSIEGQTWGGPTLRFWRFGWWRWNACLTEGPPLLFLLVVPLRLPVPALSIAVDPGIVTDMTKFISFCHVAPFISRNNRGGKVDVSKGNLQPRKMALAGWQTSKTANFWVRLAENCLLKKASVIVRVNCLSVPNSLDLQAL